METTGKLVARVVCIFIPQINIICDICPEIKFELIFFTLYFIINSNVLKLKIAVYYVASL